jgi:hypothetical protein
MRGVPLKARQRCWGNYIKLRAKKRRKRRKTKEFQRKSGVQGNTMITP